MLNDGKTTIAGVIAAAPMLVKVLAPIFGIGTAVIDPLCTAIAAIGTLMLGWHAAQVK